MSFDDRESEAGYIKITKPKAVRGKLDFQDYREITDTALRTGKPFEDPMFKPNKYSISFTGNLNGTDASKFKWIRAKNLYHDPKMLKHGHSKSDVNQGETGDCWFLAAVDAFSEKTNLFEAVVPPNQTFEDESGYTGAFRFRFWRYGKIVEVVVDDYLPVTSENKLLFTSSKEEGEFWPSLLEKAYAKLQGSYFHLNGGFSTSAMVDLSGGFPEDILSIGNYRSVLLFHKLTKLFISEGNSMACAGTLKDPPYGLVGCHAYTLLGVMDEESSGHPKLIKLRNPWGEQNYTGPWSHAWLKTQGKKKEAELLYKRGKDYFWMPLCDFTKGFSNLYMCHDLGPDFFEKYSTFVLTQKNKKIKFKLSLNTNSDSETFIDVSQMGRRRLRDELDLDYAKLPIKFQIYHETILVFNQNFLKMRNRNHCLILSPGDYSIIVEAASLDIVTEICLRVAAKCSKPEDIILKSPKK